MAKKKKKKPTKTKRSSSRKKPSNYDTRVIRGAFTIGFSIFLLTSLLSFSYRPGSDNVLGLLGHSVGWVFHAIFGIGSYLVTGYLFWAGWRLFFKKTINRPEFKAFCLLSFVFSLNMLLTLSEDQFPQFRHYLGQAFYPELWKVRKFFHLGGAPAYFLYRDLPDFNFLRIFNALGVGIIFGTTTIASFLLLFKVHPMTIVNRLVTVFHWIQDKWQQRKKNRISRFVKLCIPSSSDQQNSKISRKQDLLAIKPNRELTDRPSLSRKRENEQMEMGIPEPKISMIPSVFKTAEKKEKPKSKREQALSAQRVYNGDFTDYKMPPNTLLTNPKPFDQTSLKKNLRRQAEVLEETLLSFGIEAKVGQINCGPSITSFEVHPAIGVKVQKIKSLENDIALNMEAKSIRIIAPIPGKAAIGIEVPNPEPQEVSFKDMLAAYQKSGRKFHIPVLLGKTVNGEYVMNDLTKMPHCIIAGATGSGKSVCINTIVMSIVYNARPDEVKLIMVDPKKVELTPYSKLPHMLAPVITEPMGACAAMNWLTKEMERRYEILKTMGVRNIASFNSRKIDADFEASLDQEIPKSMHYIVAIIDELADLMMVSSNDIETYIARIAQMARAVGIHLILATQRPSREVITGLIKANFPTRISFKVSSRVNSQIILDDIGAESLLGNGDMLFLPPGTSHLMRAQGAFIRDEDISATVKHICDQAPTNYAIASFDEMDELEEMSMLGSVDEPADSLYDQAYDIIVQNGNASTTFLQRKLKIGYARAASLIDELEERGVVGPAEGSRPRKVLVNRDSEEEVLF